MPDKAWKRAERRVAAFINTVRNALSGINSKVTASDSLHPELFVEVKYSKRNTVWSLFDKVRTKAQKESKLPVIALVRPYSPGFLVVIHTSDLDKVLGVIAKARIAEEEYAESEDGQRDANVHASRICLRASGQAGGMEATSDGLG